MSMCARLTPPAIALALFALAATPPPAEAQFGRGQAR